MLAGTGRREDRWERGAERGAGIVIICAGWDRNKGGQVGEGRGERGGYCHHLCWLGPEEGRTGGRGAGRERRVLSSSVLAGTGRREDRWERGAERGAGIVIICAGWDRKKGGQVGEGRGERGGYCHHLCWLGPEEGRTGGRGARREGGGYCHHLCWLGPEEGRTGGRGARIEGRVLSSSVLAWTGRGEDRWEGGGERGADIVIICAGWNRKRGGERGADIVIICAGWDRKKGGQVGEGRGGAHGGGDGTGRVLSPSATARAIQPRARAVAGHGSRGYCKPGLQL